MNAISKAISEVYYSIPPEILNIGFSDNPTYAMHSLDDTIVNRVIRPRVMVDCNLVGGVQIYVNLDICGITDYSNDIVREYLITVPKAATNNRSIVSAISLMSNRIGSALVGSADALTAGLRDNVNAVAPSVPVATARLEIVADNKVLVTDPAVRYLTGSLKCMVENSETLSNISPRSYIYFSNMVVLAVKAFIYNTCIVKLGRGYIESGHELNIVNDIIADYASANQDYRDYVKDTWATVAFHNDSDRVSNYINGMI